VVLLDFSPNLNMILENVERIYQPSPTDMPMFDTLGILWEKHVRINLGA
jgi:hypothetical protein